MVRLPSLKALRVFEAAGRNLSFTRAAAELHVTQAAVSHQIKTLEEELGIQLFRRGHRGLLLTDAGQAYLPEVRAAFERLTAATGKLRAQDATGPLIVSVLPSFAARWLVPRLRRFRDGNPDIDVRVSATDRPVDFDRDDIDLAIRYGAGSYSGLAANRFLTEEFFPVCSPALAEGDVNGRPPLRAPEDLRWHTLLHDDMATDWPMWLLAAGVAGLDPRRGPAFTDSSMLLQAAVDGQGVALGRSALAADDLAAGRLIRPFDISLPTEYAYYILCPERDAQRPKIVAFRDWLLEEAARDPKAATG
ncbi:transcriptional regulator GcvA [Inquilinus sp. CAU 1745]|uniref:transcriptional regulator GcvA n=1 Tax=Inquilinus sp. CAU 1745 TaxID=3140369 RepID=UPI00325AD6DC